MTPHLVRYDLLMSPSRLKTLLVACTGGRFQNHIALCRLDAEKPKNLSFAVLDSLGFQIFYGSLDFGPRGSVIVRLSDFLIAWHVDWHAWLNKGMYLKFAIGGLFW